MNIDQIVGKDLCFAGVEHPPTLQDVKVIQYNCQSLRKKYEKISQWQCDVILLQGTCLKDEAHSFWQESKGKFHWWHTSAPRKTTKYTSKDTGCSIGLRRTRFSKKAVKRIELPPHRVRGRGLHMIVKNKQFHLAIESLYFNCERNHFDMVATRELADWQFKMQCRLPERAQKLGGMDGNCKVGIDLRKPVDWSYAVGPIGSEWNRMSRHGPIIAKMWQDSHTYAANTFAECGNYATYYWWHHSSRIDYIYVGKGTPIIESAVLRRLGFKVQSSDKQYQLDHCPMMMVFKLGLCYDINSVAQHHQYNVDKMMDAWTTGYQFNEYNHEVNRICNAKETQFYNAIFNFDVDEA